MPANTPVYGFTYPCPGETVDAAAFALLAGQIDTKLNDVNNDRLAALQRRNFDTFDTGSQVIAAGADTVMTTTASTYVFPAAGIWEISLNVQANGAATLNMARVRVRQNAVLKFAATINPGNETSYNIDVHGPMMVAAGDTLSLSFLYNGTGSMTVSVNAISAKLLCRIA